jgi:hypothetical protein
MAVLFLTSDRRNRARGLRQPSGGNTRRMVAAVVTAVILALVGKVLFLALVGVVAIVVAVVWAISKVASRV